MSKFRNRHFDFAWDGLRYFIVALPEPSINYFENPSIGHLWCVAVNLATWTTSLQLSPESLFCSVKHLFKLKSDMENSFFTAFISLEVGCRVQFCMIFSLKR